MMNSQQYFLFTFILAMSVLKEISPLAEFTNLVCTSMNKNFADFDYCFLKAVNRTYKYVSTKVIIYDKPITNINVSLAVSKRTNGYKPFLYNITLEGCKFLNGCLTLLFNIFMALLRMLQT